MSQTINADKVKINPTSRREDQLLKELQAIRMEMVPIKEELDRVRANKTIQCLGCGKRSPISKWTFIQQHHYIPPSGCMEGAYWVHSNEVLIGCPKCQSLMRTWKSSVRDSDNSYTFYKFILDHAQYFGEKLEYYKEQEDWRFPKPDLAQIRKEHEARVRHKNTDCY